MMKKFLSCISAFFISSVLSGQVTYTTVDDFNRANSNTLGTSSSTHSTWTENEAPSHPEQMQISSNMLWCVNGGVTGLEPTNASINLSNEISYFDLGVGIYGWSMHFDLNKAPSGWSGDRYGLGFVIVANETDFSSSTVDGWAVLWTDSNDELVFGKFSNGITGLDPLTTVIGTGLNWNNCSIYGINVRIEVDQTGNWTIWWEQGTPVSDPLDIDIESASCLSLDASYFSDSNMKYSGPIWSHSYGTATNLNGSFDNFSFGEHPLVSVANPGSFSANPYSTSQVNLSWTLNGSGDKVLIAFNSVNSFGTPAAGTQYPVTVTIPGGGTIIYNGSGTSFSHTGRTFNTTYYYKIWSCNASFVYSPGMTDDATTFDLEPGNQPVNLAVSANGGTHITVAWTDSGADNYLVRGSNVSPGSIPSPTDHVPVTNGPLVQNIAGGIQSHTFNSLIPSTEYYFKIFPYNGTGATSDYKTDGVVPLDTAFTGEMDLALVISEVSDPVSPIQTRFMEIYNAGSATVDFSNTTVYACRQSNGGATWSSLQLTGALPAGETYVIAMDAAYFDTAYDHSAEKYSDLVNINGNDGLFIYYNGNYLAGTLLDAYGVINEDGIGKAWFYEDGHAVRKRSVTSPKATWTASEWTILRPLSYFNMTPGAHAENVAWQGAASVNWNGRGSNWNSSFGYIPDASFNVTIPVTTRYPVITQKSACNMLNVSNGASLGVGGTGSLIIVGTDP